MANVLIVDDEEMDRFLEARIIEDAGHTPLFASDGEAAMTMYEENDIALVITDLRMPKVDGLSLIRNILALNPEAAIIAVSSLAQHLDKAEEFERSRRSSSLSSRKTSSRRSKRSLENCHHPHR